MKVAIKGEFFTVPERYREGHVLSAGEAQALQQHLANCLRKAFVRAVEKAQGHLTEGAAIAPEAKQALDENFARLAQSYQFLERPSGIDMLDLSRRARLIAQDRLHEEILSGTVGDEEIEELAQSEEVLTLAEAFIAAQRATMQDPLSVL